MSDDESDPEAPVDAENLRPRLRARLNRFMLAPTSRNTRSLRWAARLYLLRAKIRLRVGKILPYVHYSMGASIVFLALIGYAILKAFELIVCPAHCSSVEAAPRLPRQDEAHAVNSAAQPLRPRDAAIPFSHSLSKEDENSQSFTGVHWLGVSVGGGQAALDVRCPLFGLALCGDADQPISARLVLSISFNVVGLGMAEVEVAPVATTFAISPVREGLLIVGNTAQSNEKGPFREISGRLMDAGRTDREKNHKLHRGSADLLAGSPGLRGPSDQDPLGHAAIAPAQPTPTVHLAVKAGDLGLLKLDGRPGLQ